MLLLWSFPGGIILRFEVGFCSCHRLHCEDPGSKWRINAQRVLLFRGLFFAYWWIYPQTRWFLADVFIPYLHIFSKMSPTYTLMLVSIMDSTSFDPCALSFPCLEFCHRHLCDTNLTSAPTRHIGWNVSMSWKSSQILCLYRYLSSIFLLLYVQGFGK